MSDYPEHDKLEKISAQSQVIGEFLEWLESKQEIYLSSVHTCTVDRQRLTRLLAEYFNVNLTKLEAEKLQMLASLREDHGQ